MIRNAYSKLLKKIEDILKDESDEISRAEEETQTPLVNEDDMATQDDVATQENMSSEDDDIATQE
jgi:hypothetical protein